MNITTTRPRLLLLSGLAAWTASSALAAAKPNLLIIHTDEQNFRTLGCYRALLPKEQAFIWGKASR